MQPVVIDKRFYKVVNPDQTYRGLTYSDLMQDYYNWIYSHDPDQLQLNNSILFLRGNMIGDPYEYPKEGIVQTTLDILKDPRYVYDRTGLRGITITTNTALFIDVFDTLFVRGDSFQGNELETNYECRTAARREFELLSSIWATIQKLNVKGLTLTVNGDQDPLVPSLQDFYVESSSFDLYVSDGNKVNREPEYYLEGGEYTGVAVGVFLLIIGMDEGNYRIDFGGTQSVDYFTRSVYDINVVQAEEFKVKDVSKEISNYSFPTLKL